MVERIRVGLIGFGAMGHIHAVNLLERIPGAELTAIAFPRIHQLQPSQSLWLGCALYSDYHELLDLRSLDAIVVASASTVHLEILTAAVECKVPVFCEKPLALNLRDAIAVHQLYEDHQVPLQVAFMRRYDPHYIDVQRWIEEGAIGTPYHFSDVSRDRTGPSTSVIKNSGGIYMDMGVHDFDLARWLMSTEIDSVYAQGGLFSYPDYGTVGDVDQGYVSFHCVSQALGMVELSRHAEYGYDIRTEILGSKGAIQSAAVNATGTVLLRDGEVVQDTYRDFSERFNEAYRNELTEFIENVRQGSRPRTTGLDGVRATAIAEAATRSAESGKEEVVPLV